jgi:glutamate synthase domain-containing protein 2/rubredoxin
MASYECNICGYVYDEASEGTPWADLPDDWVCPICGAGTSDFSPASEEDEEAESSPSATSVSDGGYLAEWARKDDEIERHMTEIHRMAETGVSVLEPMRARLVRPLWDDLLIKGAQLARIPLDEDQAVATRTVIGPNARVPLVIETPIYVTHMSLGALSREIKIALAKGSAAVQTAMCSGEGGILDESLANAHRYVFEYVPNRYSVTDDYLSRVDAVEIKIGQSAKPGLGGHLPGAKVTEEIAAVRGRPAGQDIVSPASFPDIRTPDDLKNKVAWLREKTGGKPVGIKLAAGHVEADLDVALRAEPDFVTLDGRPGATGSAPKFVKDATSIPTLFALRRARRFLDSRGAEGVSLLVTGGFRISSDVAKALALGADAVATGTAALMAAGCQQYRICHTGRCPVGVTSQDPSLRERLDVDTSAQRLENFLRVSTEELCAFARLTGNDDVHGLDVSDLCTTSSEISGHTDIEHVGGA